MSVAYTAVTGGIDLAVGQCYDRAGSTWTWVLVLGVTLASIAATAVLKRLDKKAYPKLYLNEEPENASSTQDAACSES